MGGDDVLDNAVWHAIDGHHRTLAEHNGLAGRFHRDVSPFAALAEDSPQAWSDLAELVGPGHRALLFAPNLDASDGWVAEYSIPAHQLVAGDVTDRRIDLDLVDLGPQDVPEMLDLISETRPGPFEKRTIELGRYLGHRVDGRLVAMAGERLRCPGWTEVSAVCTAPDQRGRGLGAALTLAVTDHIRARGDEAFLHVASDNTTALNLYIALGFTVRAELEAVVMRQDH